MQCQTELALERASDTEGRRVLENLADRGVTPARADVLPKRFTVAVGEVLVRPLRHLLDRGQVSIHDSVTNPLLGEDVVRSARQVLCHAFHEPERRVDLIERLEIRAGLAAREDVELELVHHFVREHVLEAAEIASERHDHSVLERLGHTAGSFTEVAGDVVLAELRSRRKENDRLLLAKLVVENLRQPRVRALGHPGRVHRTGAFFRVVVHQPVLGLYYSPIEVLVLHLVHPEVLLCVEASADEQSNENRENPSRFHLSCYSCGSSATVSASLQRRSI